jgi:hypothetical protein
MKLLGIMSLAKDRDQVIKIFERNDVQIFSETEIAGHSPSTIKEYGWWPTSKEAAIYSTLFFAIISEERAEAIMADVMKHRKSDTPQHPIRVFQVAVEKMI